MYQGSSIDAEKFKIDFSNIVDNNGYEMDFSNNNGYEIDIHCFYEFEHWENLLKCLEKFPIKYNIHKTFTKTKEYKPTIRKLTDEEKKMDSSTIQEKLQKESNDESERINKILKTNVKIFIPKKYKFNIMSTYFVNTKCVMDNRLIFKHI